jgi:hypothetical protein
MKIPVEPNITARDGVPMVYDFVSVLSTKGWQEMADISGRKCALGRRPAQELTTLMWMIAKWAGNGFWNHGDFVLCRERLKKK